jgi:ketosteroid isomerase-like protein
MASEAVELVRKAVEAYGSDGLDALLRFTDPDLEFHEDPRFPEAGVYRGFDAFRAYVERFQEAFDELHFDVEELIDAGGGRVVGLVVTGGPGKSSGVDVRQPTAWIFTVRDGKVVRMDAYFDREEGLKAAGLAPRSG